MQEDKVGQLKQNKKNETKSWYSATPARYSNQFNDPTNANSKRNALRHPAAFPVMKVRRQVGKWS